MRARPLPAGQREARGEQQAFRRGRALLPSSSLSIAFPSKQRKKCARAGLANDSARVAASLPSGQRISNARRTDSPAATAGGSAMGRACAVSNVTCASFRGQRREARGLGGCSSRRGARRARRRRAGGGAAGGRPGDRACSTWRMSSAKGRKTSCGGGGGGVGGGRVSGRCTPQRRQRGAARRRERGGPGPQNSTPLGPARTCIPSGPRIPAPWPAPCCGTSAACRRRRGKGRSSEAGPRCVPPAGALRDRGGGRAWTHELGRVAAVGLVLDHRDAVVVEHRAEERRERRRAPGPLLRWGGRVPAGARAGQRCLCVFVLALAEALRCGRGAPRRRGR